MNVVIRKKFGKLNVRDSLKKLGLVPKTIHHNVDCLLLHLYSYLFLNCINKLFQIIIQ